MIEDLTIPVKLTPLPFNTTNSLSDDILPYVRNIDMMIPTGIEVEQAPEPKKTQKKAAPKKKR